MEQRTVLEASNDLKRRPSSHRVSNTETSRICTARLSRKAGSKAAPPGPSALGDDGAVGVDASSENFLHIAQHGTTWNLSAFAIPQVLQPAITTPREARGRGAMEQKTNSRQKRR